MDALAKKQKDPAGAPPPRGEKKRKHKKKKQAGAAAVPPPATKVSPRREPQRAAGGVPPAEAFNSIRRRPPPNLPGYQPAPRQSAGPATHRAAGPGREAPQPQEPSSRKEKPARPRKRVNPARQRRRRRVFAVLAIVALIAGGVVLSVNLLFKIEKYDLQGESPYTVEQLAGAFGHAPGDNMYGFSKSAAAQRITTQLPYVESVNIRRRLPSTIVFRVTTAQEGFYIPWQEGYAVLSTQRKVLRLADEKPGGLVRIDGLRELVVEPGAALALTEKAAKEAPVLDDPDLSATGGAESTPESSPEDGSTPEGDGENNEEDEPPPEEEKKEEEPYVATPGESFAAMEVLIDALNDAGLEDVDWIDVADPLEMRFSWQGRITVKLGPKSGLEEKLAAVVVQLTDSEQHLIDEKESGTLDMTYFIATGRAYFSPD